ncbi:hypothetical protein KBY74_12965 [Cyanobium sp. A1C-AMD]|nr:hypothetical protein [Cyanobium sp. A1C-AMD]
MASGGNASAAKHHLDADLALAIEEQVPRLSAALGGQTEADKTDRADRG